MKNLIKIGKTCNNNCILCYYLGVKNKYDRSLIEIIKEIDTISESNIILPCNTDIRKDFLEIIKYIKSINKNVILQTNGRMFSYKAFCKKVINFIDYFYFIYFSQDDKIQNKFTNLKDSYLCKVGFINISKITKNVGIIIPLIRENTNKLHETVKYFKKAKDIILKIINPHPLIYNEIRKIKNNRIKIIDLPFEVKLEITSRCNLTCDFCFNKNSIQKNKIEMTTEEIKNVIDKIANSGTKIFRISGGEPFYRDDIFDIIKYAKTKDFYIIINSNSTLIKKENIPLYKGIIDKFLFPFHSEKEHGLKKKIELINYILNTGIDANINTIITKDTIKNLEDIYYHAKEINCLWFLQRFVPNNKKISLLNNDDIEELINKLIKIKEKYKLVIGISGIPFCAYEPDKIKLFFKNNLSCGIINKIVIDPTGKIKPCYSIDVDLGNIINSDIINIYSKGLSNDIRKLKTFPKICLKCIYLFDCLGGCRFAAQLINGSYDSMDPLAKPEKYLKRINLNNEIYY